MYAVKTLYSYVMNFATSVLTLIPKQPESSPAPLSTPNLTTVILVIILPQPLSSQIHQFQQIQNTVTRAVLKVPNSVISFLFLNLSTGLGLTNVLNITYKLLSYTSCNVHCTSVLSNVFTNCIRPYRDSKTASIIAISIDHSKLDYCNSLYYNLQTLKTSTIRLISPYSCCCEGLLSPLISIPFLNLSIG